MIYSKLNIICSIYCLSLFLPFMKYYVVLKGKQTWIFTNRDECKRQVDGFLWAIYKSFTTEQAAKFARKEQTFWQGLGSGSKWQSSSNYLRQVMWSDFDRAICTDAACPSNPGPVEYRGVDIASWRELFSYGPYQWWSVNLAEFLAIVEGMKYLFCHPEGSKAELKDLFWKENNRQDVSSPLGFPQHDVAIWIMNWKNILYSDSKIAISWVIKWTINTQIAQNNNNFLLFEKITEAEEWLKNNPQRSQIISLKKRPTDERWQIPADFWRK